MGTMTMDTTIRAAASPCERRFSFRGSDPAVADLKRLHPRRKNLLKTLAQALPVRQSFRRRPTRDQSRQDKGEAMTRNPKSTPKQSEPCEDERPWWERDLSSRGFCRSAKRIGQLELFVPREAGIVRERMGRAVPEDDAASDGDGKA